MTKKKERIVIRNDQLLIEEENTQEEAPKRERFGSIRSFLMSPIGILIWIALISYKIYFIWSKMFLLSEKTQKSKEE